MANSVLVGDVVAVTRSCKVFLGYVIVQRDLGVSRFRRVCSGCCCTDTDDDDNAPRGCLLMVRVIDEELVMMCGCDVRVVCSMPLGGYRL